MSQYPDTNRVSKCAVEFSNRLALFLFTHASDMSRVSAYDTFCGSNREHATEHHAQAGSSPVTYSEIRVSDLSRATDRLERASSSFCAVPSGKYQNNGAYFKLGHKNFLPHPFQFIIHWLFLSIHAMQWELPVATDSFVKLQS
jgi:hypothetical protein